MQWIKNLSLFASLILNGQLLNLKLFLSSILAFCAFSFLSSSSYLINDIVDIDRDRLHPGKRNRPLARGAVSKKTAIILSVILVILGLFISISINISFFTTAFIFICLQYLYSFILKKKALFDILGIATFFIIRVYAGELTTGYHLPVWLMLAVIFLSLFIASGKRRSELVNTGKSARPALQGYTKALLNFYSSVFAVATLIAYAMFTFFEKPIQFDGLIHQFLLNNIPKALDRKWYMITLFPVIVGIMRYGQIIFETQEGERPEKIIATDIPILISVLTWGLMMITIIYVI
ncbi:UbiA prenyltransferase family protein [Patescibacteria group bacterium]|nr:UbiA prenyltransferase family protein [Patescibacteria group bacterium]